MRKLGPIIVAVAALGLAIAVTGPKLVEMAQVRGFLPGATPRTLTVQEKWHQTPAEHHAGRHVYWIRLAHGDIRRRGDHRLNLAEPRWREIEAGDSLELIEVGGASTLYLRDGIFASNGNLIFDLLLLTVELAVGIGALVRIARSSRSHPREPAS